MKKKYLIWAFMLTAQLAATGMTLADEQENRAAIVAAVESYVQAFNERDAVAVSQNWCTNGELVEANGNRLAGPDAIRRSYEQLFSDLEPHQLLSVRIERISFVTPNVAIEEGMAYVVDGWQTQYAATHKFENGAWKVHSVRETGVTTAPSHYEQLQDLDWLIGDWIDQSDDSTVESSCNWSKNRNFIRQNFKISVRGTAPLEGTQVIGYDASKGNIRSWIFDSDGGTGEGIWTRKNGGWEVTSTQILSDGRLATATNMYRLTDEDNLEWGSRERFVDGTAVPDVAPVLLQRR